jgi:hypothetical protein
MISFLSCKKKKPEQNIQFTIDAVNNSISSGSDFPVIVTLISAMPSQGISIDLNTLNQITNVVLPQGSPYSTKNVKNSMIISNLPRQQWCLVTVKVTSNNNANNSDTKSFTVIYK